MPTRAAPRRIATLHTLRQQLEKREGRFNAALSDFIAPEGTGVPDYVGGFVVTAGIGEDVVADRFKMANDDYSSILCKALADRLAEAFAERMHARVRREFWAYAPDEALSTDELILEKYQGIRPAPGYPAQPDHTEKATLFELLDAEATAGVKLTESFAMWPGSSVSGLYFANPESYYFGVGKIERDQVEDYAARKGMTRGGDRALARADAELHPVARGRERQGFRGDAGERRDVEGPRLASAGLHLRGASGLAEEARGGGVGAPATQKGENNPMHSRDGVERLDEFSVLPKMACSVGQNTCINAGSGGVPGAGTPGLSSSRSERAPHLRCRPGESQDPYRVIYR